MNDGDGSVAFVVVGIVDPWREGDQATAAQRQQDLAAGHVLQATIWLDPIPLSAKDPGYMFSAPAPVSIDRGLDWNDVVSGDGPFSDSNGQHFHCITEKGFGRQPKMKKNLGESNLTAELVKSWVETINCGLKIGELSACWTY